jgi:outer membrane protein OmpA-like peptidoglycan-associated protein
VVQVTGYTDNLGTKASNLALSRHRATNFARDLEAALSARGGGQILVKVVGAGSSAPMASNATNSGKSQNRRVVVSWN